MAACILVVEDEILVAQDIAASLEDFGYAVMGTASSANEAMVLLQQQCPDVVLMDINLSNRRGDSSGIDLAAKIIAQWGVPIIYLTAHADEATLERATRTRPLGYLIKPFRSIELHSTIKIALDKQAELLALREHNRHIQALIDSSYEGFMLLDIRGIIRYMSASIAVLLGYDTHPSPDSSFSSNSDAQPRGAISSEYDSEYDSEKPPLHKNPSEQNQMPVRDAAGVSPLPTAALLDYVHSEDIAVVQQALRKLELLEDAAGYTLEYRHRHAQGHYIDLEVLCRSAGRNVYQRPEAAQASTGTVGDVADTRVHTASPANTTDNVAKDDADADAAQEAMLWSVRLSRHNQRQLVKLEAMAYRDELTGLANRRMLNQQSAWLLSKACPIGLLYVDMNGFKQINDRFGHEAGDAILRMIGQRIQGLSRNHEDIIARLGGDEFVCMFGYCEPDETQRLAERLSMLLLEPFCVATADYPLQLEASVGFACFPQDAQSLRELLQRADAAMYQAKRHGGGVERAQTEHAR